MHTIASKTRQGADRFSAYLGPVGFLAVLFFINFLSRIILAPFMPLIEKDLGFSHTAAGSLFLFTSAGYFLALVISGFFSARWFHRRTIVLSAACLGGALLFSAFSRDLWQLRMGLVSVGMAAGLYLPSGLATITALVHPRHWGKAMGIHELAPNLGFMSAPLLAEVMLGWVSWRQVLMLLGGLSLLMALAYSLFGKGGHFPGKAPDQAAFRILFRLPAFWIMIVLFMLAITSTMGLYAMLPLYLVTEHGMTRGNANEIVGMSRLLCPIIAFCAGWANDRIGARHTIIMVLAIGGILTILLGMVHDSRLLIMIVFGQPLAAVCFFPPAFALLSTIVPAEMSNVAVSLTIPAAFLIGAGVMPVLIGMMGDWGNFGAGISIAGSMILCGSLLVVFIKPYSGDNE
ncbi:MFS transporter [Desulfobacter vibrioformis]|uniref:MFS transporter n=1 Tax=Desulfobacter vibrioformis TaxID=34031 RepID=UPI00054D8126|nr:MFS transporter [Desulfobacter vibrioformis]